MVSLDLGYLGFEVVSYLYREVAPVCVIYLINCVMKIEDYGCHWLGAVPLGLWAVENLG